jgi:hypothetical protein
MIYLPHELDDKSSVPSGEDGFGIGDRAFFGVVGVRDELSEFALVGEGLGFVRRGAGTAEDRGGRHG